jgi:hypothetical protein
MTVAVANGAFVSSIVGGSRRATGNHFALQVDAPKKENRGERGDDRQTDR